jgi:serine O-acetyltransferase
MLDTIRAQLATIKERDPAARSSLEILLCYPGLHALALHRLSNRLWRLEVPLLPRVISQLGRWITGIEIHPGARIGKGVFIDHGMGVVIGETAVVGNNCLLYQGVTLGGTGKVHGKRHPTLEDNVVVGAGAKVLGAITVGANTRIGAGAEARVIRNLMERIDTLESELARTQACLREVAAGRPLLESCGGKAQNLKDREILEFLGDADQRAGEQPPTEP